MNYKSIFISMLIGALVGFLFSFFIYSIFNTFLIIILNELPRIIGAIIGISAYTINFFMFNLPLEILSRVLGIKLLSGFSEFPSPTFLGATIVIILWTIIGALIGAVIGWLIGRRKEKKNEN